MGRRRRMMRGREGRAAGTSRKTRREKKEQEEEEEYMYFRTTVDNGSRVTNDETMRKLGVLCWFPLKTLASTRAPQTPHSRAATMAMT